MNQFLNKLERKYGRYAVPDLIRYVVILYCAGAAIGIVNQGIYYQYLSLNFEAIFHGQVWRLFTYLIEPYGLIGGSFFLNLILLLIQVNLFFLFGRSLEQAWGTFRFNLFLLSGYLLNIVAALVLYLSPLHSTYYQAGFQFIYLSMFFAFALLNPDMQFLISFIIPVKVKWLALLDAVYVGYLVMSNLAKGIQNMVAGQSTLAGIYISISVAILVAMANFLIYFFATRDFRRMSPRDIRRRQKFKQQVRQGRQNAMQGGARHRCAICGRTELDDESLDFRYCSKCEGNYEYCSDHLFTHEHIKKRF